MSPKRCFRIARCSLENRCELAHVDIKHGQFQPEYLSPRLVLYPSPRRQCWGDQSAFYWPAKPTYPVSKRGVFKVVFIGEFLQRLGDTKSSNPHSRAPIVALLFDCRPLAVFSGVPGIYVDSFKCHTGGRSTHIGKKIIKRMPSFTHGDSSPAVVMERFVGFVLASLSHVAPYFVGSCAAHPVSCVGFNGSSSSKASTGLSVTTPKVCGGNRSCISAVAFAHPMSSGSLRVAERYYCQTAKFLTEKINRFERHFRHLENFTIERVWQAVVKPLFGSYPSHARNYTCC